MKATVTMKEKKRRSTSNVGSLRLPSGRSAATFARRGKGLLKKARELSTLVGIDVCVILLPPPGEDGRGSSSSLPSPPPLTWPEESSDLLRIIHRLESVGDGKRRNHSSTSFPPPPLLTRPEEPSAMIHPCQSIDKRQNPQNCSSPPSFLLEENHRLEQELQQVKRQNLELVALSPSCGSISKDVEPLVALDSAFGDIDEKTQWMTEDKELFEFFESLPQIFEFLPQIEGENNKPMDTDQQKNQVVDIGQPLLLDFLPPSPMTCSASECWDFSLQDYWGKN
uniref:MADS-box domain-containing protein n=1 Tax=Nymphaea colorata TaxID=210225 RepID=A0A5K0V4V3_9MAGN